MDLPDGDYHTAVHCHDAGIPVRAQGVLHQPAGRPRDHGSRRLRSRPLPRTGSVSSQEFVQAPGRPDRGKPHHKTLSGLHSKPPADLDTARPVGRHRPPDHRGRGEGRHGKATGSSFMLIPGCRGPLRNPRRQVQAGKRGVGRPHRPVSWGPPGDHTGCAHPNDHGVLHAGPSRKAPITPTWPRSVMYVRRASGIRLPPVSVGWPGQVGGTGSADGAGGIWPVRAASEGAVWRARHAEGCGPFTRDRWPRRRRGRSL